MIHLALDFPTDHRLSLRWLAQSPTRQIIFTSYLADASSFDADLSFCHSRHIILVIEAEALENFVSLCSFKSELN